MSEERRDFKKWMTDILFENQQGMCAKCGRTLAYGFEKHHEDGDSSNNSIENLTLYCPKCHDSEAWATYVKQKTKSLDDIEAAIKLAMEGKASGAVIDKLVDAIKLGLGLKSELYGRWEKPPASVRASYYLESSGILEKVREEGLREGLRKGIEMASEVLNERRKEDKGK